MSENNRFSNGLEIGLVLGLIQLLIYQDIRQASNKSIGTPVKLVTWALLAGFAWIVIQRVREVLKPTTVSVLETARPIQQPLTIGNPGILALNPRTKLIESPKSTSILGITLSVKSEPKRLPTGKPVFGELRVSTPATNSGDVYIADSPAGCITGPRYSVPAGKQQQIKVSEVSKLYYYGTLNDELSIYSEVDAGGNHE